MYRKVQLTEVCDFQGGTQPPASEFREQPFAGSIRLLQIRDFASDNKAVYIPQRKTLKKCAEDDICIARYGASIGRILTGKAGAYNVAIVKTIPDLSVLNKRYFYHFLKAPEFQDFITSVGSRAAQAGFNKEELSRMTIALPPLDVQQRIADTLDTANALRRKDQELLRKHEELAQSIFHDTFGELNAHNGDYPVVHLRDLADATSGITKNTRLKPEDMVEVPYLRVANVQDGYLNLDEIKTITASARDVAKYQLQRGDIVITEGGDPDKLGRGTVWNEEVSGCSFQNHIFRIRVVDDRITPYFLSKVIGSKYGKAYFLKAAKQTTGIATINSSQLKAFPVILPPKHLQVDYEAKMVRLSAQKQLVTHSAAASNHLMKTLLQSSFA